MLEALRRDAVSCWASLHIQIFKTCPLRLQHIINNCLYSCDRVKCHCIDLKHELLLVYMLLWHLIEYLDMLSFDTHPHRVGSRLFRCVWNTVGSIAVVYHRALHCAEGKHITLLVLHNIMENILQICNIKSSDFLHCIPFHKLKSLLRSDS